MAKKISTKIMNAVEDYLKRDDWHFDRDDEHGMFIAKAALHNKLKAVKVLVLVDNDSFAVRVIAPVSSETKSEDLHRVNEFLARASYGMSRGGFELDFRDGEIAFRTSQFCGDDPPTDSAVEETIYISVMAMQRYGNAMLKVIYGFSEPEDAIEEAENDRGVT